jgi:trk system potassium uptake protein
MPHRWAGGAALYSLAMPRSLQPTTVLVLLFAAAVGLGTVLLALPIAQSSGAGGGWLTALFTATSAVCVTGLAVVDTGTHWSGFGQVVILGLIQLGGLGLMTATALLGMLVNRQLRFRTRLLLQTESHALSLGDVRSVAKLVLVVTVVMEASVALLLAGRWAIGWGMPWPEALWQGLFHAVSAFNNAGFSTFSDNLMRFAGDGWVLGWVMVAIVVGGLGFPVLHELLLRRRHKARLSIHAQLTLYGSAALVLGGTLLVWLLEHDNPKTLGAMATADAWLGALFLSVSSRTAGFNAVDIGALSTAGLLLHYPLMFIGGGSAGTAGGIKVTTFFLLLLVVWSEVRGRADVEFAGRRIATSVQRQALTVLLLSAAVITVATLLMVPLVAHLNLRFEAVLFEIISAFATVGLSTGITAQLPPAGQLLLVALMFIGRVGIVTLAVSLALSHGRRTVRYPEEKPLVG